MQRIALVALLLQTAAFVAEAQTLSPIEQRGRALVQRLCAQCHAVGRTGKSPHAGAPSFPTLDRRLDLDGFVERLREGFESGHRDMPMFRFGREDARAVVAYLRSIQSP